MALTREQFRILIGQVRGNGSTPDEPLLAVYDDFHTQLEAMETRAVAAEKTLFNERLEYNALQAQLAAALARVEIFEERLEINHAFDMDGLRIDIPASDRDKFPDGISCRDETIKLQAKEIGTLQQTVARLQGECADWKQKYIEASDERSRIIESDHLYRFVAAERDALQQTVGRLEKELSQRKGWQHCKTHEKINANYAWGCPDCVRELRTERDTLAQRVKQLEAINFDHELGFHAAETEIERLAQRIAALEHAIQPVAFVLEEFEIVPIGLSREQELYWKNAVKDIRMLVTPSTPQIDALDTMKQRIQQLEEGLRKLSTLGGGRSEGNCIAQEALRPLPHPPRQDRRRHERATDEGGQTN